MNSHRTTSDSDDATRHSRNRSTGPQLELRHARWRSSATRAWQTCLTPFGREISLVLLLKAVLLLLLWWIFFRHPVEPESAMDQRPVAQNPAPVSAPEVLHAHR